MGAKNLMKVTILGLGMGILCSCDMVKKVETRASVVNNAEKVSLRLARENRLLEKQVGDLKYEIETLKSQNKFMAVQLKEFQDKNDPHASVGRLPASVAPMQNLSEPKEDLVKQGVFHWKPEQLLGVAEKEFKAGNFEKAAQFFHSYGLNHVGDGAYDDKFLFQAGISAYESGKHHDWTLYYMGELTKAYPTSQFYRAAKLWQAMTYLKMGKKDKFFATAEEFRKNYRNTPEWQILSAHYEKIVQNYKK